jgi:ATP-binding protein involved in chromosome partitioning
VRNIIAIASGKGGVGKSTVATNFALALARYGARVGVLDADVFGPSVPGMLGDATSPAVTASGRKIEPAVHYGMKVMSIGFFVERDGAVIWRGPMVHKLLTQFLEDVEWGELDYLVCDLPPGTGDVQISLSQLIPLAGAVMVTTPQDVAIADVVRGISMFKKTEVPIIGIVENMSGYACSACGHHDPIFAQGGGRKLAETYGVPFLGQIPIDTRIRIGGDVGRPIIVGAPDSEIAKTYMEIAARVAGRLSVANFAAPKRSPSLVTIR